MREKDFQVLFGKWLRSEEALKYLGVGDAFELKFLREGERLNFNAVQEHQIEGLRRAKEGVLYYKLSDMSANAKPFDCFTLRSAGAWVVLMWWRKGGRWKERGFYLIDVDAYEDLREEKVRKGGRGSKSMTEKEASEVGIKVKMG